MAAPNQSETESGAGRLLRRPFVIFLAVLAAITGAFRIAGVSSMFLASLTLALGIWAFLTIEVWCSRWIKRTGRYAASIVLVASFLSGSAAVEISAKIGQLKAQPADNSKTFSVIDEETMAAFWVVLAGDTLCQTDRGLFLAITNLQSREVMVKTLGFEMLDSSQKWHKVKIADTTGPVYFGVDKKKLVRIEPFDGFLVKNVIGRNLPSGETQRGLILLNLHDEKQALPWPGEFRLTITEMDREQFTVPVTSAVPTDQNLANIGWQAWNEADLSGLNTTTCDYW